MKHFIIPPGNANTDNQPPEAGFRSLHFPGNYNDKANVDQGCNITADLLLANPDLADVEGFDSYTGPV